MTEGSRPPPAPSAGIVFATLAAVLFGASTPFAKLLLGQMPPVLLAGLLYLGSGAGLSLLYLASRRGREAPLTRSDAPWLAGAVLFGGVLAPVLLLIGLQTTPASTSALLLNLEGVSTALIAWFVFREGFDRRIAVGMLLIVAGGVVLSWQGAGDTGVSLGALAIAAACLCWGVDNNLTQKVSASNPYQGAAIKGAVAGAVNTAVALGLGAHLPSGAVVAGAMLVGFLGYGLSLAFFVLALRHIGTARTGAFFSTAPFVGALVALALLREPVGLLFAGATALMAVGVWLHLTERHAHLHTHFGQAHTHAHAHERDHHHHHDHGPEATPTDTHAHPHVHDTLQHAHAHYPDIHHRHGHDDRDSERPEG
ncbi:MAG TPA: EamA family transporter [Chthonomonadales bacterium]|nr:EamA family transporter [Chthonomonadales bacterium]